MIPLDRNAGGPLRDQIYASIRSAIVDGTAPADARLPSTRELARQLGVSRLTVDDAYARLAAEEYTVGRRGSGTYVAPDMPLRSTPPAVDQPQAFEARRLSRWGQRLPRLEHQPGGPSNLPFKLSAGTPALDAFPWATWRRLAARETRDLTLGQFDYGPEAGLFQLRRALAGYMARSRGVRCAPDQVVITSGTHQSIDVLTRLLIDPGDRVLVEEPGYPVPRAILVVAGAELVPLPVDGDGVRTDLLEDIGASAKLLYVTPSHQHPTGAMLPLARRLQLLQWARRTGSLVLEDDYDSELRYDARPVPALAALASADRALGRVAYLGTFSKVLFPALRLGYVVLDSDLVEPFIEAKRIIDRHPATQLQATVTAFIDEGHFERHLVRMRRLYASRQAALNNAIDIHLRGIVTRDEAVSSAGLHVLVRCDVDLTEREIIARAAAQGIDISGAGDCFFTPPERPHLLMGYAALPEDQITEAVRRLGQVLGR